MSVEFQESPLLAMIREVFRVELPEWKLGNAIYSDETRIYSEWQSDKGKLVVQIVMLASSEDATANLRMFDRKFRQAATALPDLGDENNVWTDSDEMRGTVIKFRTGNAVVQVSGPDLDRSVKVARPLAKQLKSR